MVRNEHFQKLKHLYISTLSDLPSPSVTVAHGQAQLRSALDAAGTSEAKPSYPDLLNDVATLAAGSLEKQQMVTAEQLDTEVMAPDYEGPVVASARVVLAQPPQFVVEAVVETPDGAIVAQGRGVFRPGEQELPSVPDDVEPPTNDEDLPPATFIPVFATPFGPVCLN